MIVTSISSEELDSISVDTLMKSLQKHFPDATITLTERPPARSEICQYNINIEPANDSSFTLTKFSRSQCYGVDGLDNQNSITAVAIREAWGATHQRIIAADGAEGWFVDLVPGMTSSDVENGQRPLEELQT